MIRWALLPLALACLGSTTAHAQAGTVRPGMTAAEVRAAWGEPQATRERGSFTYLVFPTSCLPECGSHDVVILENGRVVDAIARSNGRRYEGTASYTTRTPAYTPAAGAPR